MKKNLFRMLRSGVALLLVVCMVVGYVPTTVFATNSTKSAEKPVKNYVSLGDSMTNGYGLTGYGDLDPNRPWANAGVEDYADLAYPMLFESYLEEQGYDVEHAKLAMSGIRTEDIHWLLEFDYKGEDVNVLKSMIEGGQKWDAAKWYATWGAGDYWTLDQIANHSRTTWAAYALDKSYENLPRWEQTALLAEYYQESVKNADIISLSVGNGNIGVFGFGRILEVTGFDKDSDTVKYYNIDDLLRECDDKMKGALLSLIADLKTKLPQTLDPKLADMAIYIAVSLALNYAGTIDAILQMNPDVEIILLPVMNTFANEKKGENFEGTSIGDMMGLVVDPINKFLAALPTYMQVTNHEVYKDAQFYYAEPGFVQCMVDTYATDFEKDPTLRDRFITDIIGCCHNENPECKENPRNCKHQWDEGMIWGLMADKVSAMVPGATLQRLSQADIEKYMAMSAEEKAAYAADASTRNLAISCALYMAFEDAIIKAGGSTAVSMESILGLSDLMGSAAGLFGAVMEDFGANIKANSAAKAPEVYAALAKILKATLAGYGMSVEVSVQDIQDILAGKSEAVAEGFIDQIVYAQIPEGADKDAYYPDVKATVLGVIAPALGTTPEEVVSTIAVILATNMTADNANMLCMLLAIPETLSASLVKDATVAGLLSMMARCMIGHGLGAHPSAAGHFALAQAVIEAYKSGHTAEKETDENVDFEQWPVVKKIISNLTAQGLLTDDQILEIAFAVYENYNATGSLNLSAVIDDIYAIVFNREDLELKDKISIFAIIYDTLAEYGYTVSGGEAYSYVMNLVDQIDTILNNNLAGVIADLEDDLDALRAELNTKVNDLNVQLQKLTAEEYAVLQEMLGERDALVEQLNELKAQLETLTGDKQVRINTYSTNSTNNSADELIEQLKTAIAETEAAIAALDASIAALDAKIAADLEGIAAIQDAIASIETQINGILAALADMEPAVQQLNADLEVLYNASMVLTDAINNVNNLTFDKIDIQAVVDAVTTIYNLVPSVMNQLENVYNDTKAAYEYAKDATASLKVTIDGIEAKIDEIVNSAKELAGIEAEKLNAIQAAIAECEKAVQSFIDDNYDDVETALTNSYNELMALAYGEIAKAQNVLEENKTMVLAIVAGAILALQEAGFIEVDLENGEVNLAPEYQQMVNDYTQMLTDKLAELRERVETAKQWLNDNYPIARAELDNKLTALREELSKLEAQMREEYDPEKLANLKIECEQLQKLIDEVTAMQDKLDAHAQEVLDYIATVEAAIAEVQTALDAVIAAGSAVGSDIEALWNKLVALTPMLDELAKAVNSLNCEIVNELNEIFAYCGIIGENFIEVLKTLPAYVDVLRNAVNLAIDTWNVLVKTARDTVDQIMDAVDEIQKHVVEKYNDLIQGMHNDLDALIELIEKELETATGEAKIALENLLEAVLALKAGLVELTEGNIYSAISMIQSAHNNLIDALNNGALYLNAEIRSQLMTLVNNLGENIVELVSGFGETVKNILGENYDALIQHIVDVLPNVDAWLYDWLYNNPDLVIAWLNEYGDDFLEFLEENADAVVAVIGYLVYNFGDDIAEYVMNNANVIMKNLVDWHNTYGEKIWEITKVYLDSLGILDSLHDVENQILDKIAGLEATVKDLETQLEDLKAQLDAAIAAGNTALAEQLSAAIEMIEAEIAKIKTAIAEVKDVLQQLREDILTIEQAIRDIIDIIESNANIETIRGQLKKALEVLVDAIADAIDTAELVEVLENALNVLLEQGIEACVNYLKGIGDAAVTAIAEAMEAALESAVTTLTPIVKNAIETAKENIINAFKEILYNALNGEYTVTDDSNYVAITGNGNGYVDLLANALWLKGTQYDSMTWGALDYEALMKADLITIGYDENTLNAFATEQLLGYLRAYIDVELRGSANAYANGVSDTLLAAIPFLKPEAFAGVVGSVNTTIDELLANELLANRQMEELDWAALVGEENVPYVAQVLEKLRTQMITMGIPEYYEVQIDVVDFLFENAAAMGIENVLSMLDRDALKETLGEYSMYTIQVPVREALMFAAESYLYGNLEFQKNYAETMMLLYEINPDATVIVLGHYNAFRQVELTMGDVSMDLGETYDAIAKILSVHPFAYALLMPNVIYVDIPDVQTNYEYYVAAGYIENSFVNFLSAYMSDATMTQASPIGNEYIKEQILAALTVTCDHIYTDCSCLDEACGRCGEVKEGLGHSFTDYISDGNATCTEDGTETAKCDCCDATDTRTDVDSALGHEWGDWYTTKEATNDEEGEERRDCQNCDHYETRVIPKIVRVDPEYTVPSGLTATYGDTLADVALPEGFTWKDATASVGNAGVNTFIAIFTPADTIHYNTVEVEVSVTVAKANAAVTTPPTAVEMIIANGTAQTLINAGVATGGTMVYSLSENGAYSSELPKATDFGVYTVYYMVLGDANHNDTQVQSLNVTIYPGKITSDLYIIENAYIRKITAGITVEQLLDGINEKQYVTVFNADGTIAENDALVATGMVIKLIINGQVIDSVTAVVTGDVNGDGKISVTDMVAVKYHVLGKTLLTGVYEIAADTSGDNSVSITDFLQIKYSVLGKAAIEAN